MKELSVAPRASVGRKSRLVRMRQGLKVFLKRLVRSILHSRETPQAVALGAAIGIFVAFTPTMGFQMIIAGALATLCGASRLPAFIMVYISNPLTALPIYYFCYRVGQMLLALFGVSSPAWAQLRTLFQFSSEGSLLSSVWGKFMQLFSLGWDLTISLWLGCILVGAVAAGISYPILLRFVEGHRLIRAQKRARKLSKRMALADEEEERTNVPGSGWDH